LALALWVLFAVAGVALDAAAFMPPFRRHTSRLEVAAISAGAVASLSLLCTLLTLLRASPRTR
jgi:hypothetical protein